MYVNSASLSSPPPSLSLLSPPSPMLDSVHQKHGNSDQLAEDFQVAFRGCELADVAFIVGDTHMPLYAVKAILACRSRSVELCPFGPFTCAASEYLVKELSTQVHTIGMYMYTNKSLQEILRNTRHLHVCIEHLILKRL